MEKKLNMIEELNEDVKVEELDEKSLESVDGGSVTLTIGMVCTVIGGAYATGYAIGLGIANIAERTRK